MDKEKEKELAKEQTNVVLELLPTGGILKTTLRSFFWVIVILSLLSACFFNFFPYQGMKFYSEYNLTVRAYQSAQMFESRNGKQFSEDNNPEFNSKYVDALLMCNNLAITLMNESTGSGEKKYSAQAVKYIDKYLRFPSLKARTKLIDDFNIKNSRVVMRPNLYSYQDYISTKRAKALLINGQKDKLYLELQTKAANLSENFVVDGENIEQFLTLFNCVSEYIEFECSSLSYFDYNNKPNDVLKNSYNGVERFSFLLTKENGFTTLYNNINKSVSVFKDYVKNYQTNGDDNKMLKQAYYVKSLGKLAQSMLGFGNIAQFNSSFYSEKTAEEIPKIAVDWSNHNKIFGVISKDQFSPLNEWYLKLLTDYAKALS